MMCFDIRYKAIVDLREGDVCDHIYKIANFPSLPPHLIFLHSIGDGLLRYLLLSVLVTEKLVLLLDIYTLFI